MEELEDLEFRVNGAGNIRISNNNEWKCGGELGYSFGVSWGKHGYTGGNLPKEEAIRLAEHILITEGRLNPIESKYFKPSKE